MPAFVAPAIGLALGALLGWLATLPAGRGEGMSLRWSTGSRDIQGYRPLLIVALFSGLVFTPICAYFLLFWPDWSYAYAMDAARIPSAIDLLLLMVDAGSVLLGFVLFERMARDHFFRAFIVLAVVPLAISLIAVLALSKRLGVEATYQQYHGDFGVHRVAGGPLGYALVWMHAMLIAGLVVTARALRSPTEALEAAPPPAGENKKVSPKEPGRRLGSGRR